MDVFFLKLLMANSALSNIDTEPIINGIPGNWKNGLGCVK